MERKDKLSTTDEKDEAMVLTPGGPRPRSKTRRVAADEVVSRGQGTTRVVRAAAYGRAVAELARSQGLVLTPGGFRHPSRVHRLERHEGIIRSGEVTRKLDLRTKGASDFSTPETSPQPGVGNGWITDATCYLYTGSTTFTYFKSSWKVPAAPTSQDGQTIYIFNALMDAGDILQPVLQWGTSKGAGGDEDGWTVTCWYIDPSGNAYYHDPIPVSEGEELVGVMNMTAQSNGLFNYDCFFEGIDGTNLTMQGITHRTVATETLECYSMGTCSDYPHAYFVAMTDVQLDVDGSAIQPAWIPQILVPNCGAHTNIVSTAATGGEVDLFFHGQAPGWKLQQLTAGTARTAGPQAVTNAFASVYGQQEHLAYRDVTGQIWDSWYDGPSNSWNLQRINGVDGNTAGAEAASGPFVSVFNDQQHFTYTDDGGGIWDSWYRDGDGWNFQGINLTGGTTTGPAAAGDVFVSVYGQQQHFVYTYRDGTIWDAWYDGGSNNWNLQQINLGGSGRTGGPAAAGTPFVFVFGQQQHFAYVDSTGTLWDAWYDGISNNWNLQQINLGGPGRTEGPMAAGAPYVSLYGQQQHFAYVDAAGTLWDAWYDAPSNNWNLQQINLGGAGRTAGPPVVGEICVSVFGAQQHFAYSDGKGGIWDAWYDGPSNSWNLQEINQGGRTGGPAASGDVFVWVFNSQQHFTYLTGTGALWDAWYDSGNNSWNLQQINAGGLTDGPPATADPYASVFGEQEHVGYLDAKGLIRDVWHDGATNQWGLQQINFSGKTSGNPAASGPVLSVFGRQQHFVYRDFNDTIWDSWYDAANNNWNLQQINHNERPGGNAVGDMAVSVFGQQQHFAYLSDQGTIWDAWYDGASNSWGSQALNNKDIVPGALTKGPAAQGGPSISVFGSQQHFAYVDSAGTVWDVWYNSDTNAWNPQAINNSSAVAGARTIAPPAAGTPFACAFGKQQHFSYRDASGTIWDAFYDSGSNSWKPLQITGPSGSTNGPPAVSGPFVCAFGDQLHFVYVDSAQVVWDAFGDLDTNTWTLQQVNLGGFANGGLTAGPAAVSCPFVWVYGDQQHFTYRDPQGIVWDAWYEG